VPAEDGKTVTEVDVQAGLSDGANTEIVSGLSEGQRIVAIPASNSGPRGFFGAMGGG